MASKARVRGLCTSVWERQRALRKPRFAGLAALSRWSRFPSIASARFAKESRQTRRSFREQTVRKDILPEIAKRLEISIQFVSSTRPKAELNAGELSHSDTNTDPACSALEI